MLHTVAVDQVFQALADPTRRHILELVAEGPDTSASTLALHLPVSRQAIVKHLKVLETAGLVSRRREGKSIRFCTEPHQLAMTGRWLQRIASRLEETAEEPTPSGVATT